MSTVMGFLTLLFLLIFVFSVMRAISRGRRRRRMLLEMERRRQLEQATGAPSSPFDGMPFGGLFEHLLSGSGSYAYDMETGRWIDLSRVGAEEWEQWEEPDRGTAPRGGDVLLDEAGRLALLRRTTSRMPTDAVDLEEIAATTEGFSAADLMALTEEAARAARTRSGGAPTATLEPLTQNDLLQALERVGEDRRKGAGIVPPLGP